MEKYLRRGQGPNWAVEPLVVMAWRYLITKNSAEKISELIGLNIV
jgi:hypothetical protein